MKNLFVIVIFICSCIPAGMAKNFKGFSLVTNGGYSMGDATNVDIAFQPDFQFGKVFFEPKLGIMFHSFYIDYAGLDRLNTQSLGLFLEATLFPFQKYFFTGLRFELINVNAFSDVSVKRLEDKRLHYPVNFPSFNLYGILGISIPLADRFSFRFSVIPGIRTYTTSDWNFKFRGSQATITLQEEPDVQFDCQFNIGFAVKLWKR
ncbi:MAG: hypothetical protein LBM08_02190 [Dysgonamonadaceae bacterium]|jgi:hypothetical protein|nr:hypothetical protein [Dysgonamonadaceae bacterium]